MKQIRLQARAVAKRFGRIAALRGVDFEIDPGEAVAILGANGAGKSTLLRILAGLARPTEGVFHGTCIDGDATLLSRQDLRSVVGYVGHATLLYGELTAAENLRFAGRLAGGSPTRETIDALLEEFDLQDVADRRAGTFSRGMSQRLAIARAIIHQPRVLLLDEPFTGLDEVSSQRLSAELHRLREGGRTLVLVTHDPRRATELASRALLLHRGKIVARAGRDEAATSSNEDTGHTPSIAGALPFTVEALRGRLVDLASDGGEGAR